MVGAEGLSSSGTARRSKSPVSERVSVRNTLFSEEDKGRIDCSPLKGRAARPWPPAAARGQGGERRAPLRSRYAAGRPPPAAFRAPGARTGGAGRGHWVN